LEVVILIEVQFAEAWLLDDNESFPLVKWLIKGVNKLGHIPGRHASDREGQAASKPQTSPARPR
jgi:hypothetical protein